MSEKYEMLLLLRKITKLNIVDFVRVRRECSKAEEVVHMLIKHDPTHTYSVDYTKAIDLEIRLRTNTLKYNLYDEWKKYISVEKDGFTLEQYALRFLNDYAENNSKKKK